jgi:HlyD family secretion protein
VKKRLVLVGILALIVVAVLLFLFAKRDTKPQPIKTTGIVEGVEVNISTTVSGRILRECCEQGDAVEKGATVIELKNDDLRALVSQALAGVEKAKAEVAVSESAIESSKANILSAEADMKNVEAEIEKARAQMEETKRHMDRLNALYKKELISKESFETAAVNYDTAVANYTSSKAQHTAASSRRDAAVAQLRTAQSQLTSAKASLKEAEATLSYSRAKLAETIIASPVTGTVVFKAFEQGETVSPGMTILTIVDLNNLYVRVDIDENMIGSVALNSEAFIRTDEAPERVFAGRVSEIGRYAEFATQKDVSRGRQDIKTFKVKISVPDSGGFLKPGMTVEVEIPKGTQHDSNH